MKTPDRAIAVDKKQSKQTDENPLIPAEIAKSLDGGFSKSNLAFALLFLPKDQRADMAEYYRFCRIVDDIADSETLPASEKFRFLDGWLEALSDPACGRLPEAFAELILRRSLDCNLIAEVVRGVRMDVEPTRLASIAELEGYCWKVAGAVGVASLPIFGAHSSESRSYAEALGLGLQLTNIIRDVGEDAEMGRVYLPQDLLAAHGLDANDVLRAKRTDPAIAAVASDLAAQARAFYTAAAASLVDADRAALKAPEAMHRIYARLLTIMESDGFRVIEKRYKVPKLEMAKLASSAFARAR